MKQAINTILFLILLSVIAAMLFMPLAHATNTPQVDPASSVANSTASAGAKSSSQSSSAIDLSLASNPAGGAAYGGSIRGGNSYALMGGGTATPLPPGLCPKSNSYYLQVLGGLLFTVAWSENRTEMECLEKVLQMLRDTAPKPVPLVNYVAPQVQPLAAPAPVAVAVECKAPEPAKPKPAKGKKTAKVEECGRKG